MSKRLTNQVFLDKDGLIHNLHVGNQTKETVSAMLEQLAVLAAQLRAQHLPVLVLVDLSKLGSHNTGARQAAAQGIKQLDYDRAAAFGGDPITRYVVSLVVRASGRADRFRYFETKAEAEAFLGQASTT